jgi:uncharacterized protein YggL (DUF469 family)
VQQVKLADRHQQDTRSEIDRFINQVIQLGKLDLHGTVSALWRVGAAALDLDFRCKLDMVGNVRINKWHQPLLAE